MSGPGKPIIKAEHNLLIKAKKLDWVYLCYPHWALSIRIFYLPLQMPLWHYFYWINQTQTLRHILLAEKMLRLQQWKFVVVVIAAPLTHKAQWAFGRRERMRKIEWGERKRENWRELERERKREPEIVASFTNWHSLINSISWFSGTLSKGTCLCVHWLKLY